ncbi:spermidine synthase [Actinomadura chibensis]|uniref:Spermidine synthase n=1 Tax=Actinomadura chibensis TaxID=392828 RepID=A0A5D0NCH0_9ACTN|nr:spermidine synthase [Actinomadura chibensis]TYB42032.1 spermidine synthase [Actinomadura chibensis]
MGVVPGTSGGPVVVERAEGVGGELVLRRAGGDYEIISNGVFLMDTRGGASERLLVRAAVEGLDGPVRVLIGGLGVGFSLAEALDLPGVAHVTVVEREPAVVDWHRGVLRPWSRGAVDDPRVTVRRADLLDVLAEPAPAGGGGEGGRFDALCLDIDNGPGWTVTPGNARLYSPAGLDLLAARLTGRGTLAVWSAAADAAFEALLRDRFEAVEARPVPVPRGEPDVVYLARRPRRDA